MAAVVFTFMRANPPTEGHSKVIRKVIEEAKAKGAEHVIYLSQTVKPPKDPLPWEFKIQVATSMFPGINISKDATVKTPFQALEVLGQDYDDVTMVVGDDRVGEFQSRMAPYAEQWGIQSFDVVSAGARDPDAAGTEGISASKVRQAAVDGDYDSFASMMSDRLNDSTKQTIYTKIRSASGLDEDANNDDADRYRNMGLRGEFAYSGWG